MTQNNDFNDEKKRATKMYLDQVHQRLYLEQTLLVERIKTYFTSQLDQQIAPTIQKLNSVHVLIQPHFKITAPFTDDALLRISLEEMLSVLPKQLSKRKILKCKCAKRTARNDLYKYTRTATTITKRIKTTIKLLCI